MPNEILQKSRTRITAQGNGTALTATYNPSSGSYTGDTPTTLDNTYDGNCKGADFFQLELDVTSAPATATTAQIWYRGSEDGTNYTGWKYSHTVGDNITTSAARYDAGLFSMSFQYVQLAVMAVTYGFTAALYVTPKLMEAQ